jgi:hypothetical protein
VRVRVREGEEGEGVRSEEGGEGERRTENTAQKKLKPKS